MNSASQDFPGNLSELRDRMLHPTDYEDAVTFFLEEFAGDLEFIRLSETEAIPVLTTVLERITEKMLAAPLRLDRPATFRLTGHPFIHGNAVVQEHAVLFFYFPEANTGIAALIPGVTAGMEIARFQIPGGLARPDLN